MLTTPKIGSVYVRPCVKHPTLDVWFPVLGPRHRDADHLRFDVEHWHYDTRFLDLATVPDCDGDAQSALTMVHHHDGVVEHRPFVCLRETPEFPDSMYWLADLEEAFSAVKADCRTCPHRGVPLEGQRVVDGIVTCPGHGLRWDVASGRLRRATPEATQ